MRLAGKNAIVSGGLCGIGAAIVRMFEAEGASVVVLDIKADEGITRDATGRIKTIRMDLLDHASVIGAVDAVIAEQGSVDILVNCAALGADTPFLDTPVELFDRVLGTNLRGTFLLSQAVARHMVRAGRGSIINYSSQAGEQANTGRTAYGSSKAWIVLLTKIIAVELATTGVRANVISPGPVVTPFNQQMQVSVSKEAIAGMVPMGRYGEPDELATATVFLASDEASYITGHTLHVDGGCMARGLVMKRQNVTA